MAGAQQFRLVQIPAPNYDITDPSGAVVINQVNPSGQLVGANGLPILDTTTNQPIIRGVGTIAQWMDGPLARAWFDDARVKLSAGQIALALQSIMHGFNALNITWYSYPESRRLWRKYIAGPPQIIGSSSDFAEFGLHDYNVGWFTSNKNNSQWPGWGCAPGGTCVPFSSSPAPGTTTLGSGSVTDAELRLAQSVPDFGSPPVGRSSLGNYAELTPTLWPFINVPQIDVDANGVPSYPHDQQGNVLNDPTSAPTVQNTSVYWSLGFVDERQGNPDDNFLSAPQGAFRNAGSPGGPNIDMGSGTTQDANVFSFDNPSVGYKRIGIPLSYYVPWLDEWIGILQSHDPQSIVAASRIYTTYVNNKSANTYYGGPQNFIRQVINLPQNYEMQETTGSLQNDLRVAGNAAAAVGGALAGVTFGISALIGGAAALALNIAASTVRNTANIARDEFGRFKPVFERGWLSGNPGDSTTAGLPLLVIPAPSGFTRGTSALEFSTAHIPWGPATSVAQLQARGALRQVQNIGPDTSGLTPGSSPLPMPSSGMSTTTMALIGLAVLGVGYVGYRVIASRSTGKPATASAPPSPETAAPAAAQTAKPNPRRLRSARRMS